MNCFVTALFSARLRAKTTARRRCAKSKSAHLLRLAFFQLALVEGAGLLKGKNAGCGLVIGMTQGSHTREELAAYPHDYLIATLTELPALLKI